MENEPVKQWNWHYYIGPNFITINSNGCIKLNAIKLVLPIKTIWHYYLSPFTVSQFWEGRKMGRRCPHDSPTYNATWLS